MPLKLVKPDGTKPKFPAPEFRALLGKSGETADIIMYGVIGDEFDGLTDAMLDGGLRKIAAAKTLNIRINSPGGSVHQGRAIFNRLRQHNARKIVHVDGEASSIAALIAMAGDEVRMGEGTFMLVHRAWTITVGNANDLRDTIKTLEIVDAAQVETFAKRTGMKPDAVQKLMDEDRYMDAREAVARGFADVAEGEQRMAALVVDRKALHLPQLPKAGPRPVRAALADRIAAIRG